MQLFVQLNVLADLFSYILSKIFLSLTSGSVPSRNWRTKTFKELLRFKFYCWLLNLILFPDPRNPFLYYETISTDHGQLKSCSLVHSSSVVAKFCHTKHKQVSIGCTGFCATTRDPVWFLLGLELSEFNKYRLIITHS